MAVRTVDVPESVCPNCSTVVTTKPTSTKECLWHDAASRSRSRVGGRVTNLWADRGLGTGVPELSQRDASGGVITRTQSRVTTRRAWTHERDTSEIDLDYALGEIRRMAERFDVPRTEREEAARLYRTARDADLLVGRSAEGFATACLLAAVRRSSRRIPVSESELLEVTRATRSQIRTARGVLEFELEIGIPPLDPRDFVPRVVSELGVSYDAERHTMGLLEKWLNSDAGSSSGVSPRSIAGAAIHAALDEVSDEVRPSLADIAATIGVSQSTISTRKSDLLRITEGSDR